MNRLKLNICTYNVMLAIPRAIKATAQSIRAKSIPVAIRNKLSHVDVFIFTELPDGIYRDYIVQEMALNGYLYSSSAMNVTAYNPFKYGIKLIGNGIVICSKYRIIDEQHIMFGRTSIGSDTLMNKGGVLVTINLNTSSIGDPCPVRILGVHLQAWDSENARDIRNAQMLKCAKFVQAQQQKSPIILAGDLNVDFYSDLSAIQTIKANFGVRFILPERVNTAHDNKICSWAPKSSSLAGLDNISAYSTMNYPSGCVNEYKSSGVCPCCPDQLVDYIGIAKNGSFLISPIDSNIITDMKTLKPYRHPFANKKMVQDLSDHLPLVASFAINKQICLNSFPDKTHALIRSTIPSPDASYYTLFKNAVNMSANRYVSTYSFIPELVKSFSRDTI